MPDDTPSGELPGPDDTHVPPSFRVLRPDLMDFVDDLRGAAVEACPGRTAELVSTLIAQLVTGSSQAPDRQGPLHESIRDWHTSPVFDSPERALLAVIEQFVIDVHGVTDEQFEQLRSHYTDRQIIAIFYHAALSDGFSKLNAVWPDQEHDPCPPPRG